MVDKEVIEFFYIIFFFFVLLFSYCMSFFGLIWGIFLLERDMVFDFVEEDFVWDFEEFDFDLDYF